MIPPLTLEVFLLPYRTHCLNLRLGLPDLGSRGLGPGSGISQGVGKVELWSVPGSVNLRTRVRANGVPTRNSVSSGCTRKSGPTHSTRPVSVVTLGRHHQIGIGGSRSRVRIHPYPKGPRKQGTLVGEFHSHDPPFLSLHSTDSGLRRGLPGSSPGQVTPISVRPKSTPTPLLLWRTSQSVPHIHKLGTSPTPRNDTRGPSSERETRGTITSQIDWTGSVGNRKYQTPRHRVGRKRTVLGRYGHSFGGSGRSPSSTDTRTGCSTFSSWTKGWLTTRVGGTSTTSRPLWGPSQGRGG